jgi:hypothetical protein
MQAIDAAASLELKILTRARMKLQCLGIIRLKMRMLSAYFMNFPGNT